MALRPSATVPPKLFIRQLVNNHRPRSSVHAFPQARSSFRDFFSIRRCSYCGFSSGQWDSSQIGGISALSAAPATASRSTFAISV